MNAVRHKVGSRMSQAVRAGNMVYLVGQIPDDRTADIVGQTAETLGKIDALLSEMGGSKADLVSVQVWLSDMKDFVGMNLAWEAWVDPQRPPITSGARSLVFFTPLAARSQGSRRHSRACAVTSPRHAR
ncbi:MAG: RidA family protein [Marivivens sp.]